MISLLTTPTRAYEAYNNSSLIVIKHQQLKQKQEQELKNLPFLVKDALNNITRTQKPHPEDICGVAAAEAEQDYLIKPELLQTIASVESGRYNKKLGRRIAWPWAVQVGGKGYYFKTKQEAVTAVKELYAEGITNIDVGCMQINLKYHGHAFKSLEDALDPKQNVAYSARFLKRLYQQNGHNWQTTAMQYHSKNHAKGQIYKTRLEKHYAEYINPNSMQTLF